MSNHDGFFVKNCEPEYYSSQLSKDANDIIRKNNIRSVINNCDGKNDENAYLNYDKYLNSTSGSEGVVRSGETRIVKKSDIKFIDSDRMQNLIKADTFSNYNSYHDTHTEYKDVDIKKIVYSVPKPKFQYFQD